MNMPDAVGVGPTPVNISDGVRFSSAVAYLLPARERENLTILGSTRVRRVVIRDHVARSVEVEHDGNVNWISADEIVLCAGAIASPQILMLSGVGPAEDLRYHGLEPVVDLPGVGANLRDHPVLSVRWSAPDVALPTHGPKRTGAQVGIRSTTPGSDVPLDMRIMSFRRHGAQEFSVSCSLMKAASSGSVKLHSADPLAAPVIDMCFLSNPADGDRMKTMLDVVRDLVMRPAYDGLRQAMVSPTAAELDDIDSWMLATVTTGHHAAGTCRMGSDGDDSAVVDELGRVHGVQHLRVADASIMVDCPRVNINCASMMIGEKLAVTI